MLSRNFRTRFGEIDLVMEDAATVVFVEVRYRGASPLVAPAESVDRPKQRRLCRAAEIYLRARPELAERPCRFDVVALADDGEAGTIQWIPRAFDA